MQQCNKYNFPAYYSYKMQAQACGCGKGCSIPSSFEPGMEYHVAFHRIVSTYAGEGVHRSTRQLVRLSRCLELMLIAVPLTWL